MKRIPLTKGKFALVDEQDHRRLSAYSWYYGSTGYAFRSQWLFRKDRRQKNIAMHREVMGVTDPRVLVDHINGDQLDNRRSNLRLSTKSTNGCNRGKTSKNTTGYKGVTRHKQCKSERYIAQIRVNNKNHYLGLFPTPEAAARAYDAAALHYFGEYAQINGI